MALHFLAEDAADAVPGDEVVLTGAEAHHAASVRRLRVDEVATVGDGAGTWLDAVCIAVSPREVRVRVTARTEHPADAPRVTLVQALAKGDRDELAIQAATELGIARVVPWQAERSVSRWDGKSEKGVARWRTIVREAAKQAHRAWVPEVAAPVTTAQLAAMAGTMRMLVLEPTATLRLSEVASVPAPAAGAPEIALVVGPEGGIAPGELTRLAEAGAQAVRLGDHVLRTSTAGAAALAVLNVGLGRW